MMINMEVLTYLEIHFRTNYDEDDNETKDTVNFSQLIEACPATLTDLIIVGADLTFNETTSNITSIQNLKFKYVEITEKATITGTSFPELSVFYLDAMITRHLTISLPDHHLKKADIEIEYPKGEDCVLSVNTMNSGKPQRSLIRPGDEHDNKGQPSCGDTLTSSSTERIIMDFTCASAKESSSSISEIEEEEEEEGMDGDEDEYYGTRGSSGSGSGSGSDSYDDEYC
jgi:hypothetical protein